MGRRNGDHPLLPKERITGKDSAMEEILKEIVNVGNWIMALVCGFICGFCARDWFDVARLIRRLLSSTVVVSRIDGDASPAAPAPDAPHDPSAGGDDGGNGTDGRED